MPRPAPLTTLASVLKLAIIVLLLFLLARLLGRLIPRIEITFDRSGDDLRAYAVMREHFPEDYERLKLGMLSDDDERRLYLDCVEILGARREIERL